METLAYKYRLKLSEAQKRDLDTRFAVARKCWNFYVDRWEAIGKDVKKSDKHKQIRKEYREFLALDENAWMLVGNRRFQSYLTKDLDRAWDKFFKALKAGDVQRSQAKYRANFEMKKGAGVPVKWSENRFSSFYKPKFKSFRDLQSFQTDSYGGAVIDLVAGIVAPDSKALPLSIAIKPTDKIFNYTIEKFTQLTFSRSKDGRYYVSIGFTGVNNAPVKAKHGAAGIDLGCKDYAVVSDGTVFNLPDEKRLRAGIKAIQQKLSKSYELNKDNPEWDKRNWDKLRLQLAKKQAKMANRRSNATHQFTKHITDNYSLVGVEDLNVKGMTAKAKSKLGEDGTTFVRNNKQQKAGLNRSVLSKNFYETRRQLIYKSEWKGGKTIVANRYFASSQTCNCCREKTKLSLGDREWTCKHCGTVHDRDENAAINLRDYAIQAALQAPETKQNAFGLPEESDPTSTDYTFLKSSISRGNVPTKDRRQKQPIPGLILLNQGLTVRALHI